MRVNTDRKKRKKSSIILFNLQLMLIGPIFPRFKMKIKFKSIFQI